MMRFELGLDVPDPTRARISGLTIAISYTVGGFIPLLPYVFFDNVLTALYGSVAVTPLALFLCGYVKSRFTGWDLALARRKPVRGLAAAAAFGIARLIA